MHAIIEEFPYLKSKIKDLTSRCKCCKHHKNKDGLCEKDNVLEKWIKIKEMRSEGTSSFTTLRGEQSNAVDAATYSKTDRYSFHVDNDKIEINDDKLDLNYHMKAETSQMKKFKQELSCVKASTISSPTLDHREIVSPLIERNSANVVSSKPILSNENIEKSIIQAQDSQKYSLYRAHNKENDPTEEMIWFGSKSLSLATVRKVRHSKLSVLASELCGVVFSSQELALCSLKGKKTNAHKNAFQKQTINEEKVKGIIEYIAKYFSKSPDDIKDEVCKAIGNKLNNFSKTFEGKKIINEHLAEKSAQQQVEAHHEQQLTGELNSTANVTSFLQIATSLKQQTISEQQALQQLLKLTDDINEK